MFTAIGTVAVAVMAIWGDWVRANVAGPRLTLQLRERGSLVLRTDEAKTATWNDIFYHLEVSNERGWSRAEAVRVLVVGVARRRPDGSYLGEPLVAPMQLTWAFPEFHELFPTIGDGRETCDLGFLVGRPGAQVFSLRTYIPFAGQLRGDQAMRVTLVASAHNGESERLVVEISWDGVFSDSLEEMQKHLVVKAVS